MEVLILDDHALFRSGLHFLLDDLEQITLIHEFSNSYDALSALSDNPLITLLLLDLHLADNSGFATTKIIREKFPNLSIIIISSSDSVIDIKQAFHLGVRGYIGKTESPEVMLQAIKLVISGGVYIPSRLVNLQDNYYSPELDIYLTPKQVEVLKQIELGLSNKQIADRLDITLSTIKGHTTAIFKTLGVHNRTQAVLLAKTLNL